MKYLREIAETAAAVKDFGADISVETELIGQLSERLKQLNDAIKSLETIIDDGRAVRQRGYSELSFYIRDKMIPAMSSLRRIADDLECRVAKEYWPMPTYSDLLFNI